MTDQPSLWDAVEFANTLEEIDMLLRPQRGDDGE